MRTISKEQIHEIDIKKSRFITHLQYVENEEQARAYIEKIRNLHPQATHNCTAYKCGIITRIDDDGEPNKTAGLPMLEVLNHHQLDYVCCVVTRYFGGVKLGAGGLIRAYAKAVSETLKITEIKTLVAGYHLKIKTTYQDTRAVEYMMKTNNYQILNSEYGLDVNYELQVDENEYLELTEQLSEINHLIEVKKIKAIQIAKKEKHE